VQIKQNISLKTYNTFGIDVKAKHFVSVISIDELKQVLLLKEFQHKFILSGGSNMLLTKDVDALVIHLNLKGISIVSEDDNSVTVKAYAGENWHEFVIWCLKHDFGGLENLSLIPGNVGTAPIQNIGAYGVELKDTFLTCDAIKISSQTTHTFTNSDCNFGYRHSIFKAHENGKYIITCVTFKLSKKNHKLHTNYGAITDQLKKMDILNPTIQDVSKAVIAIRESKLPNPKEIGNSGSFFKNPVVSIQHFNILKTNFPDIPSYPAINGKIKIPAGWLIEYSGFKGKRFGNYGVHAKQALVLVNYDNANGNDILKLSILIQKTIKRLFNISLEAEVNIL